MLGSNAAAGREATERVIERQRRDREMCTGDAHTGSGEAAMPTRGTKRKFGEWEEPVVGAEIFLRQSLLNLSLEKFHKGRSMAEPSLRRYVLIANTLRIIQDDVRHDGPCPPPHPAPVTYDPAGAGGGSLLPPDLENILLPVLEDEFSVSSTIAAIMRELESVLDESCPQRPFIATPDPLPANQMKESPLGVVELIKELVLATPPTFSAPMDTSEGVASAPQSSLIGDSPAAESVNPAPPPPVPPSHNPHVPPPHNPADEFRIPGPSEAVFGSFEILNSGYLNDVSLDDPFSDIDTSVFEKDSLSPGGTSARLLPAPEELWFQSSCNAPSLRDPNDLDNIMEILVGS